MLSFCTSPNGLLDENEEHYYASTKRQRRTSLPVNNPKLASVKRVASFGGKRGSISRRGTGAASLKALISQPKDFVHLSHLDNSSSTLTSTRGELARIDTNAVAHVVDEEKKDHRHELTSPLVASMKEIPENEPTSALNESARSSPAAPATVTTTPETVTTLPPSPDGSSPSQCPVATNTDTLSKPRRASMIKRKPVPMYDTASSGDEATCRSPVSTTLASVGASTPADATRAGA